MTIIRAGKQEQTRTERILEGSLLAKNDGEKVLARGLLAARDNGGKVPMLGGFGGCIWERDIKDISDAAARDGYSALLITDKSTGLMGTLHGFAKEGWTLGQPISVPKVECDFGSRESAIMAILITKEG